MISDSRQVFSKGLSASVPLKLVKYNCRKRYTKQGKRLFAQKRISFSMTFRFVTFRVNNLLCSNTFLYFLVILKRGNVAPTHTLMIIRGSLYIKHIIKMT